MDYKDHAERILHGLKGPKRILPGLQWLKSIFHGLMGPKRILHG